MGYDLAMKNLVLGLLVVFGAVAGVQPGKITPTVPAIYVLGDSTLDVGNNNYLPGKDVPRANMPFYGIDFPGTHMPTGRFSNGYNIADFVARTLGFKKSPPAYLSLKAQNYLIRSALLRGVNYASAGAGILDSTDLYKMGARKFGIINVGPEGGVPVVRVLNATGDCNAGLNQLAFGFDGALKSLFATLALKLPGFAYSLADGFALSQVTLANPQAAGFVSANSACCGSGRLGAEGDCLPNATLYGNRDQ